MTRNTVLPSEVQQPNGTFVTYRQTDWLDGPAESDRVAVGTNEHDKFANVVLLSNASYKVIVQTKNLCGDSDHFILFFTTGDCDLRPDNPGPLNPVEEGSIIIYPNPVITGTSLNYTSHVTANIYIYLTTTSGNGNSTQTLLKQADSGNKQAGSYIVYFPEYELSEGLNYISIHAGDQIIVKRVQKN
ncbi:hypothetical protein QWY85_07835 [Neolewinella lacunae]|uniref:Uncharacterized protein n=1 Tax=Neolewinella lacunae TaxID=1517758 RepID=A0A923T7M9_9BACT|nr:hypothetical protein [Neolewinella lacunae]MBC6994690.1 hypothetical protein [Neolewinella lacunae]MDN3634562.1 hypothetical protein [Neolewinella lacunae]